MSKKTKRKKSKHRARIFLAVIVFGTITCSLGYNLFNNLVSIKNMKVEKEELVQQITNLQEEKEELENDIEKLNDPDYIAKYVREKYFYSKDGELILRLPD